MPNLFILALSVVVIGYALILGSSPRAMPVAASLTLNIATGATPAAFVAMVAGRLDLTFYLSALGCAALLLHTVLSRLDEPLPMQPGALITISKRSSMPTCEE